MTRHHEEQRWTTRHHEEHCRSMRRSDLAVLFVAVIACACAPAPPARTPEQFVENLAAAYRGKDPVALREMTIDISALDKTKLTKEQRFEAEEYDPEQERLTMEVEMARETALYRSWLSSRYIDHRVHGDHIHVDVQMSIGPNRIVLVPQPDGTLKLHPRPKWFE